MCYRSPRKLVQGRCCFLIWVLITWICPFCKNSPGYILIICALFTCILHFIKILFFKNLCFYNLVSNDPPFWVNRGWLYEVLLLMFKLCFITTRRKAFHEIKKKFAPNKSVIIILPSTIVCWGELWKKSEGADIYFSYFPFCWSR